MILSEQILVGVMVFSSTQDSISSARSISLICLPHGWKDVGKNVYVDQDRPRASYDYEAVAPYRSRLYLYVVQSSISNLWRQQRNSISTE
jgi:hypothetical protein